MRDCTRHFVWAGGRAPEDMPSRTAYDGIRYLLLAGYGRDWAAPEDAANVGMIDDAGRLIEFRRPKAPYEFFLTSIRPSIFILVPAGADQPGRTAQAIDLDPSNFEAAQIQAAASRGVKVKPHLVENPVQLATKAPAAGALWFSPDLGQLPTPVRFSPAGEFRIPFDGQAVVLKLARDEIEVSRVKEK
ncbi:hypothetical protein EZ216_11025 [Ramlibacter humi]|uniref:Uncharacterized protein n=2 Tax=Ramlibacter humi TaxID=2530451 RepID=A0A4Z0BSA4_9BURK|nr:hypothetical protein EZ216_11025 [Ramlibacter humi]